MTHWLKSLSPKNIPTPPTEGFFWFEPPHPSGNSSFVSYFSAPSPLEFPMALLRAGMDIFWICKF